MKNKFEIIVKYNDDKPISFDCGLEVYAYEIYRRFFGFSQRGALDCAGFFGMVWMKDDVDTPTSKLIDFVGTFYHYFDIFNISRNDVLDFFYEHISTYWFNGNKIPEKHVREFALKEGIDLEEYDHDVYNHRELFRKFIKLREDDVFNVLER